MLPSDDIFESLTTHDAFLAHAGLDSETARRNRRGFDIADAEEEEDSESVDKESEEEEIELPNIFETMDREFLKALEKEHHDEFPILDVTYNAAGNIMLKNYKKNSLNILHEIRKGCGLNAGALIYPKDIVSQVFHKKYFRAAERQIDSHLDRSRKLRKDEIIRFVRAVIILKGINVSFDEYVKHFSVMGFYPSLSQTPEEFLQITKERFNELLKALNGRTTVEFEVDEIDDRIVFPELTNDAFITTMEEQVPFTFRKFMKDSDYILFDDDKIEKVVKQFNDVGIQTSGFRGCHCRPTMHGGGDPFCAIIAVVRFARKGESCKEVVQTCLKALYNVRSEEEMKSKIKPSFHIFADRGYLTVAMVTYVLGLGAHVSGTSQKDCCAHRGTDDQEPVNWNGKRIPTTGTKGCYCAEQDWELDNGKTRKTYLNMQKYIQKKYLYWMYEMVDDMIDDRNHNFFRQDKLKYDKTLARMPTCENVDFAQMVDRVTLKVRIQIQQHMEELTELLNMPLPRLKHVLPKIVVLWNKIKGLIDDFSEFVKKHQGKFPSMEACGMVWLRATDVFLSNTHRLIQMAMMEKHVDSIKTWEAFINKRNGLGQTYSKTLMNVANILGTMSMSSLHSEDDHVPEKTQVQYERAFTLKLMKKTRRSQWDEEGFCEVRKEGEGTHVTTNCADSKMYQIQKGLINQSEITTAKDLISCKTLTREEVQAALEATKKPGAKATQQLKGRCKVCYAKVECDATNCDKKCDLDPRIARNRGHDLSTAMVDYCDSCGVFLHNCERSVLVNIGTEARPIVQIQKIHCWQRFHSNLALPKLPVGCFVPENIMNEYEALDNGPVLVGTDSIRKRRRKINAKSDD
eukprot:Nk52_evm8s2309 gene=Nk52_evmTU8s2309